MLFHRYLLFRYPAFILSLTVFFVGRSLGDSGSCSTCVYRLRILAAASHPYCASHAAAGNGADDVCAVLRCVVSDGYCLRKRGDDRRYLHDLGKQYAHWGCLKSWLLFRHPREFKIKSLYSNDLILNIASKSKETVQKLKFLDSPRCNPFRHLFRRPLFTDVIGCESYLRTDQN